LLGRVKQYTAYVADLILLDFTLFNGSYNNEFRKEELILT
jgi:hypothetical protein